jgi:hypothetical protein
MVRIEVLPAVGFARAESLRQICIRMVAMTRRARVVSWHSKAVPPELPAGRCVVDAAEDDASGLSTDEETGIEAALESYRQGRVVDAKRARQIIEAALGR